MKTIAWFIFILLLAAVSQSAAMDVFVSIPPQKWLSDRIGGDHVATQVLIDKSQEPHTFEPTPRQLTALARARLYFTVDLPFEQQIKKKIAATTPDLTIINTAAGIAKMQMDPELHHAHDHAENHEATKDEHPSEPDPHIWLSPLNLTHMAKQMARAFITADPERRADYERNLAELTRQLDELHRDLTKELKPYAGATILVFHPAFGYFAKAYQLEQRAVETGGKAPSPRQLAAIITKAREDNIKAIFVQPQFDPKSATAVAQAIGGKVLALDPLAEDVYTNLASMGKAIGSALAQR